MFSIHLSVIQNASLRHVYVHEKKTIIFCVRASEHDTQTSNKACCRQMHMASSGTILTLDLVG